MPATRSPVRAVSTAELDIGEVDSLANAALTAANSAARVDAKLSGVRFQLHQALLRICADRTEPASPTQHADLRARLEVEHPEAATRLAPGCIELARIGVRQAVRSAHLGSLVVAGVVARILGAGSRCDCTDEARTACRFGNIVFAGIGRHQRQCLVAAGGVHVQAKIEVGDAVRDAHRPPRTAVVHEAASTPSGPEPSVAAVCTPFVVDFELLLALAGWAAT
ncbi:hypothetical protein ON010_g8970 [Phytophthora cinnamomi]|nr:hypothetical protein ON010_g8970 [Phytophthora cinnamomi]